MSTMWPDEYTGGSHQGATNGAYAARRCRDCGARMAQAEGCNGRCWACHNSREVQL